MKRDCGYRCSGKNYFIGMRTEAPLLLSRNTTNSASAVELAADSVSIVWALVEHLTGRERYRRGAVDCHEDAAFQHVDEGVALWRWTGSCPPGGYSTVST